MSTKTDETATDDAWAEAESAARTPDEAEVVDAEVVDDAAAPTPAPEPAPAPAEADVKTTTYLVQHFVTLKKGRDDVEAWVDLGVYRVRSGDRKGAVSEAMGAHGLIEGTFRPIPEGSSGTLTPKSQTTITWS